MAICILRFDDLLKYIDNKLKEIGFIDLCHFNYIIPGTDITLDFIKESNYSKRYIVNLYINGQMKNKFFIYENWFLANRFSYICEIDKHFINELKNDKDINCVLRFLKIKKIWKNL